MVHTCVASKVHDDCVSNACTHGRSLFVKTEDRIGRVAMVIVSFDQVSSNFEQFNSRTKDIGILLSSFCSN